MSEETFGILEPMEPSPGRAPNPHSTVCDAECKAMEVWFTWWPADSPEPLSDPSPVMDDDTMTWVKWLADNCGWEDVIGAGQTFDRISDWGVDYLLRHGIAPMQPFCVRLSGYRCYLSSYEYNEYDEEWEADVVQVEPWSAQRALAAWESWLRSDDAVTP